MNNKNNQQQKKINLLSTNYDLQFAIKKKTKYEYKLTLKQP